MSSISTRTGDGGLTDLGSGERVRKDDARVEAYGTVDELSCFLGEAKHWVRRPETLAALEGLQRDLFRVAGELASRGKPYPEPLLSGDEERLYSLVERFERELDLRGFVVPGSTVQSARLDIARAVARRAERRVVTLARESEVSIPLRKYLNRLSDLLFVLARWEEAAEGKIVNARGG
ncbi:MAG TPA: cob(I)yrinic acid a,c-diamide adenosyltransferase [Magnetospirillaceae bacterium]|nr:cob(I)yrinic acid a,c-diamide adenosyltransferase [Magnetospirillaceae bacterium]